MDKKNFIIAILVAVIVLMIVIVALFYGKTRLGQGTANSGENTGYSDTVSNGAANPNAPFVVNSNNATITPASNLSAMPGSAEAPKQEVVAVDKIPAKSIKIKVSDKGFEPQEFTVKSGQSVTLAITSTDSAHVFLFPNASLMALTTMVNGGETKIITFNAPNAGTYSFRDDLPANRANTGNMIVK